MANASYEQTSFVGGVWSQTAQGRTDLPEYKTAVSVSLNGLPLTTGAWTRRPGLVFGAATKGGFSGRVIEYAMQQANSVTMEFTDGFLRFYYDGRLATTNDQQTVSSISTASPALVTLGGSPGWPSGATVMFNTLGTDDPLLSNRQFIATAVGGQPTEYTLTDAITGANIDGSTLATFTSGNMTRVQELVTQYTGASWAALQSIQADDNAIIVHGGVAPQVLTPAIVLGSDPVFALSAANFLDGPYLDIITNGALAQPSALQGTINLTITFVTWDVATAYSIGDFVNYLGTNYESLLDGNLGNTPNSSPSFWAAISAAEAIGPSGFTADDVGRHVRLSSEPPLWNNATSYATGQSVTYGEQTYWTSLVNGNIGNVPGVDIANWKINPTGALWTWGKITGLLNFISGAISGVVHKGTLTVNGGLAAAFDGNSSKPSASCATATSIEGIGAHVSLPVAGWIGQDFTGISGGRSAVSSVTIFGSNDHGLGAVYIPGGSGSYLTSTFYGMTAYLYGSNTAPVTGQDGTLLGSTQVASQANPYGIVPFPAGTYLGFGFNAITIPSNDLISTWKYVWVYLSSTFTWNADTSLSMYNQVFAAQLQIFNGVAVTSSPAVSLNIEGPPLLNTSAIRTWRLGLYTLTNGFPTCGTYHEGRLWLAGSVNNRFDGSKPNQPWGESISFAPTNSDGSVDDSSAVSYTLNAPSSNTILWMKPDLQGILMGTEKGEWLTQATTLNSPLSALNIQSHEVTIMGSSITGSAIPVRTEHTTVFIQRFARKLVEYFADIFSGKFTAPDLAEKANHLTSASNPLVELAYQQNISPTIWARTLNGTLLGCSYRRDTLMASQGPTVKGWHNHVHGNGRLITSITNGPSPDGTLDSLAAITAPLLAGDSYHVCFMSRIFEETDTLPNAVFLDEAITPSSSGDVLISSTHYFRMNGLWHLNGKTVTVFAGGLDCGDYLVTNGRIDMPYSKDPDGAFTQAFVSTYTGQMPVLVGHTYTSQGMTVRPNASQETGARNGPAFGKLKRSHQIAALLVQTQGISFGPDFSNLHPAALMSKGGTIALLKSQLYSGIFRDTISDDNTLDAFVAWQITRPYPATIAKIGGFLATSDI